jgi:hypothetical protein
MLRAKWQGSICSDTRRGNWSTRQAGAQVARPMTKNRGQLCSSGPFVPGAIRAWHRFGGVRISFAASDAMLDRGIEVLRKLAGSNP